MRTLNRYHTPISFVAGLIFVLTMFVMTGCAGGNGARIPDPSAYSGIEGKDIDKLLGGRNLYLTECASCHKRVWPDERSPEEWPVILGRHKAKVNAGTGSFDNLVDYLVWTSAARNSHTRSNRPSCP